MLHCTGMRGPSGFCQMARSVVGESIVNTMLTMLHFIMSSRLQRMPLSYPFILSQSRTLSLSLPSTPLFYMIIVVHCMFLLSRHIVLARQRYAETNAHIWI